MIFSLGFSFINYEVENTEKEGKESGTTTSMSNSTANTSQINKAYSSRATSLICLDYRELLFHE